MPKFCERVATEPLSGICTAAASCTRAPAEVGANTAVALHENRQRVQTPGAFPCRAEMAKRISRLLLRITREAVHAGPWLPHQASVIDGGRSGFHLNQRSFPRILRDLGQLHPRVCAWRPLSSQRPGRWSELSSELFQANEH